MATVKSGADASGAGVGVLPGKEKEWLLLLRLYMPGKVKTALL